MRATPGAMGGTLLQESAAGSENAAADPIPSQTASPIGSLATYALALLAVAGVLYIWRRRLHEPVGAGADRERPFGRIADWPAILLGGMIVWVAQVLGASSAVMLLSITDAEMRMLRGGSIVALGGYLGAGVGTAFVLAALPGMARLIRLDRPWFGAGRTAWRAAGAFALVFPLVMTAGWLAALAARWMTGMPPDAVAHETLRLLSEPGAAEAEGRVWWWMMVLCVLVGAPVVEEIVYRGFIQSAIRRAVLWRLEEREGLRIPPRKRAAWIAVLGASAVFALMHAGVAEWHALATLFVLSVCFGVVCERTGRLAAPIVMHVMFNGANLLLSLVG